MIGQLVREVFEVLPGSEVLVVDDGSDDHTELEAERAGARVLRLPFNLGIGGAVRSGLVYAVEMNYDLVVRLDGDGQHDPRHIPLAVACIESGSTDMVIGSRYLGTVDGYRTGVLRRLGIAYFARLVSFLTGRRYTDTTSGQWVLNRRAIRFLAHHLPSDYPEIEGLVLMCRRGLTIVEQDVQMRPRETGRSSITFLLAVYYVIKVTLALLIGQLAPVPAEMPTMTDHARLPLPRSSKNI